MKRIAALLLVLALLLPCLGMADTLWYCPKCGRPNNDNFCPTDGTARPATGASNATGLTYSNYAYEPALLNQKMATRTGPGTTYAEGGSYDVKGQYIQVLAKAYDKRNEIWWVKCVIPYRGKNKVLWTGYQRFDHSTLPLDRIPEEFW